MTPSASLVASEQSLKTMLALEPSTAIPQHQALALLASAALSLRMASARIVQVTV
jgi:hypothetical protein